MKTLLENWNNFLDEQEEEQATLDQIKDTPDEAVDLIKKASAASPEELRALLQSLIQDPEIADTIKTLKTVAGEQDLEEGALADKMLQTYIQGDVAIQDFFKSASGQKIKKYGGPVLALALLALKIVDPPASNTDIQAMMKLASQTAPEAAVAADSITSILDPTQEIHWNL